MGLSKDPSHCRRFVAGSPFCPSKNALIRYRHCSYMHVRYPRPILRYYLGFNQLRLSSADQRHQTQHISFYLSKVTQIRERKPQPGRPISATALSLHYFTYVYVRIAVAVGLVKRVLQLQFYESCWDNQDVDSVKKHIFWPGMTKDIKEIINACGECSLLLPSQASNPSITQSPSSHPGYPMQHIGIDLFSHQGATFIVCVDHWSGYPMYKKFNSISTATIIKCLTSWFNVFILTAVSNSVASLTSFLLKIKLFKNCPHGTFQKVTV